MLRGSTWDFNRENNPISHPAVWEAKYEFISFRWFSEVLGGPARYVHFLETAIIYGDLLRPEAKSKKARESKKAEENLYA
ncbi:MAG: hypothetical protein GX338_09430 [Firmicutes bacterium]|jgi:hypothetical protein|nr:hypothetical protein [Bacillota bacterium]